MNCVIPILRSGALLVGLGLCVASAQELSPQQSTTGPVPPPGAGPKLPAPLGARTISGVPGYLWRHGCGPTAVGMVVGYYDTHGCPDLVPGDAATQTAEVNQAIASQGSGIRGSGIQQHYEDYSLPMDSGQSVPIPDSSTNYPAGCHPDNCVADFMQTSWSSVGNFYGWSWSSRVAPAFTSYVNLHNRAYNPQSGQYGMGETLWSTMVTEINNNRPMVFLVDSSGDGSTDHFVTIVGYNDSPSRQYACLDTWNPPTQIRWCQFRAMSSSYAWGVWGGWTFRLASTISGQVRTSRGVGISGVVMNGLPGNPATDSNGVYSVVVAYNWSGTVTPTKASYSFSPASRSYNNPIGNQTGQDYVWTPPPPWLSESSVTNGVFGCWLNGAVGSTYTLEVSSDLGQWLPAETNTIPDAGRVFVLDQSATNYNCRFYRAVASE